jgi:outer membrane protein OmpA-like peptidoglycan-associated protein
MGLLTPVLMLVTLGASHPTDAKGSQDHPLVTRMADFRITHYKVTEFGSQQFFGTDGKERAVEGKVYWLRYYSVDEARQPGFVAIKRNYENALKGIGAKLTSAPSSSSVHAVLQRASAETWVKVEGIGPYYYDLTIVEVAALKQEVTANADALKGGLAANGHVELTGIFFDTGKSDLKAESEPALAEVEKLLKASPQLAIWVVGHTDAVGTVESNLALSNARAAAVVKALVEKRGVGAKRLAPFGAGPYSPVATNATEEGRARNRRVELVAR